jgi:glycosidase
MKKLISFLVVLSIVFCSCKQEQKVDKTNNEPTSEIAPVSDTIMENAVIYEANIRQYSPEGTFDAFTKDIPELKQLGVKIIWLMPINPISQTKRKATGGDFASKIEDEAERNKMLGSYYAVSDYTKVNPEFGTIEDFRELVKTAHQNGIYVILDWVPNHTGWDHVWIKTHPEFYVKNAKGEITDPLNDDGTSKGWGDVAQLDYSNMAMQDQMIKDMMYWVEEENIDGFRCDHIEPTPVSFWEKAIPQLKSKKEIFMLAENDDPKFMKDDLFDMEYGWKLLHVMNDMAKGKKTLHDFDNLMKTIDTLYEKDDILMNFTTNHDENSWNGTLKERMPNNKEIFTTLTYTLPGMPLIYSGQEYDLDHVLKFFEKDSIPKTKGSYFEVLKKLGALKNTNPALNGGKQAASYQRMQTGNDDVLMFNRSKAGSTVTFIGNFSDMQQSVTIDLPENATDYMSNSPLKLESGKLILNPWEYKILVN